LNGESENRSDIDRIVEGSLTIDSPEAFEDLIGKFPDHPFLARRYADFLAGREALPQAASHYQKAADLFAGGGMILQALAAKIMEWKAAGVSRRECRDLYAVIRDVKSETPLNDFFSCMAYPELVAMMTRLEVVRSPAGDVLRNPGDMEEDLSFIVSGTVMETSVPQAGAEDGMHREQLTDNGERNYFGNIYPFDIPRKSEFLLKTAGSVESLKISKAQLIDLFEEYPNIEILVMRLTKAHLPSQKGGAQKDRKAARYELQTRVDMTIFRSEPGKTNLILKAHIQDVSMGGACIVLGEK
jgi:hypothetical protein